MRKFHEATDSVVVWGTGTDMSIKELAEIMQRIVKRGARIEWDRTKPDGTPRNLLDVARIWALGCRPKIALEEGIRSTYDRFKKNPVRGRSHRASMA